MVWIDVEMNRELIAAGRGGHRQIIARADGLGAY